MPFAYTDIVFTNAPQGGITAAKLNLLRDDLSAAIGSGGGGTGPAGPPGPTGPTGATGTAGVNAYTSTTADFSLPSVGSTVSANVVEAIWIIVGQMLWIDGGGGNAYTLQVMAKSGNNLTLKRIT